MESAIIRQGELVGQGLMAYETTEEMGSVAHLLVDVKQAQVTGLAYKTTGLVGRKQDLGWAQVVKIGGDRIIIQSEAPDAVESQLAAAQDITNLEIWTDGGDHIGRVVDVCFDQRSGAIAHYLFILKVQEAITENEPTAALFGEEPAEDSAADESETEAPQTLTGYMIAPSAIISAGRKRMMIAEEDAKRAQPYGKPLTIAKDKSARLPVANWRPEQLPEMPAELGGLLEKGQALAGQVSDRVRQQAKRFTDEQFVDRDVDAEGQPDISEQLQEKTAQVKDQMQQQLQRARERAQEQLERAQEQIDKSGLEERLEETLEKMPFGKSLGKRFNKLTRGQSDRDVDPIDVASFEVWEEDE
ncbi:MAG: hypothetical protein AAFR58_00490 [Cyanobacteria bacterium J06627_28]